MTQLSKHSSMISTNLDSDYNHELELKKKEAAKLRVIQASEQKKKKTSRLEPIVYYNDNNFYNKKRTIDISKEAY